jgi:hypothetical protein
MSCAYLLKTKNNLVESFRPVKVLGIGTINNQQSTTVLECSSFFCLAAFRCSRLARPGELPMLRQCLEAGWLLLALTLILAMVACFCTCFALLFSGAAEPSGLHGFADLVICLFP